jgi:hypothetical protein
MHRFPAWLVILLTARAFADPHELGHQPTLERRLHFEKVEASSFLFNDWNKFQENYHPSYIGDDDPATAWVEGVKGPGIGEWVRVQVTLMQGATQARLRIRNGFQKSERLFKANARARGVTIMLLPSKALVETELADKDGWQEVVVPQPSGPLDAVEIRVRSAYPGTKYDDLGLSDVQLYVTATTPDNPSFERTHLQALLTWKKERAAAALLFKQASAKTLPIAPQYRVTVTEGPTLDWREGLLAATQDEMTKLANAVAPADKARIERWRALLAPSELAHAFTPARVASKDKRALPVVDGLCRANLPTCEVDGCDDVLRLPSADEVGWLSTEQLGVFDAVNQPTLEDVRSGKLAACQDHDRRSVFTWVHRLPSPANDGRQRVDAILLARCGGIESREDWHASSLVQLLGYDEQGRLVVVAQDVSASLLRWKDGDPVLAGGRGVQANHILDIEAAGEVAKR